MMKFKERFVNFYIISFWRVLGMKNVCSFYNILIAANTFSCSCTEDGNCNCDSIKSITNATIVFRSSTPSNSAQRGSFTIDVHSVRDCSKCQNENPLQMNISASGQYLVTSPGYPFAYCPQMTCKWTISGPSNSSMLQVFIADFNIGSGGDLIINGNRFVICFALI